jgi:hypothetical protein
MLLLPYGRFHTCIALQKRYGVLGGTEGVHYGLLAIPN